MSIKQKGRFLFKPHRPVEQLMTKKVPVVNEDATIGDVEKILLKKIDFFESINYIYIVNNLNHLIGVISIKELFRKKNTTPVKRVMNKNIISVKSDQDQENAAYVALRENIKAIPVVGEKKEFYGVVLSDEIQNIIYRENREDLLRLAGISHRGYEYDNIMKIPILKSLKHRLPWLIFGLIGGVLAAEVVKLFEFVLLKNIILAAFIPLIVYMSGASGAQIQVFTIRDIATNKKIKLLPYFLRHFTIIFLIGLVISILGFFIVGIFYGSFLVGAVLAVALLVAMASSAITGLLIPYVFNKLKFDPANGSGPIATILQDVSSILIYFLVAYLLL